jgi:hypothetical protein
VRNSCLEAADKISKGLDDYIKKNQKISGSKVSKKLALKRFAELRLGAEDVISRKLDDFIEKNRKITALEENSAKDLVLASFYELTSGAVHKASEELDNFLKRYDKIFQDVPGSAQDRLIQIKGKIADHKSLEILIQNLFGELVQKDNGKIEFTDSENFCDLSACTRTVGETKTAQEQLGTIIQNGLKLRLKVAAGPTVDLDEAFHFYNEFLKTMEDPLIANRFFKDLRNVTIFLKTHYELLPKMKDDYAFYSLWKKIYDIIQEPQYKLPAQAFSNKYGKTSLWDEQKSRYNFISETKKSFEEAEKEEEENFNERRPNIDPYRVFIDDILNPRYSIDEVPDVLDVKLKTLRVLTNNKHAEVDDIYFFYDGLCKIIEDPQYKSAVDDFFNDPLNMSRLLEVKYKIFLTMNKKDKATVSLYKGMLETLQNPNYELSAKQFFEERRQDPLWDAQKEKYTKLRDAEEGIFNQASAVAVDGFFNDSLNMSRLL